MAYILKKVTGGGGGGDATAANQQIQIALVSDTNDNSVFKDPNTDLSFFVGADNKNILTDADGDSVFKTSEQSVFKNNSNQTIAALATSSDLTLTGIGAILLSTLQTSASTQVLTFQGATLAAAAALLQTSLQASPAKKIINISFSTGSLTQYNIILVYNP